MKLFNFLIWVVFAKTWDITLTPRQISNFMKNAAKRRLSKNKQKQKVLEPWKKRKEGKDLSKNDLLPFISTICSLTLQLDSWTSSFIPYILGDCISQNCSRERVKTLSGVISLHGNLWNRENIEREEDQLKWKRKASCLPACDQANNL